MPNFFDKLKKGMGIVDLGEEKPEPENKDEEQKEKPAPEKPADKEEKPKKTKTAPKKKPKKQKEDKEKTEEREEILKKGFFKIPETPEAAEPPETKKIPKTMKIEVAKEEKNEKKEGASPKPLEDKKWLEPEGQLAVDVYETDGEVVIQSAIAGIRAEDLDISIENDVVAIRGKREKSSEKSTRNYFYQECYWGYFSREIILPAEVDPSRTEAGMKDGVLTIRIPKIEREKRRKITVR